MNLNIQRTMDRGRAAFSDFTMGQKTVTALAVVGLLLGGLALSKWASQPSYTPLFSNLAASDASAISDKLNARKESFKLADGGQTILVPGKRVYQLRLDMSKDGLPTGGVSGYSLLDKQGITTSEFQQNVEYKRAIEGELAKTITAIDGVQAAVVHVVIPTQDLFAADDRKPTASVLVQTSANKQLGTEQVQAVVHLVAASVEGLTPEAVTVADSTGRMLNTPGQDGRLDAASSIRSQQTADFEQRLSRSLNELLVPVVGAGHVVTQVSADLDFDSRNTQTEKYIPDPSAPPISETTTKETYTGTGAASGGVLGPDNIAVPTGTGGDSSYSKEGTTKNNALGREVASVKTAPGQIKQLHVAVLIDKATGGSVDTSQVQALVATAAGLDTTRGDSVQVSLMPFDDTAAKAAAKELRAAQSASDRNKLVGYGRDGLLALLAIAAVLLGLRRARGKATDAIDSFDAQAELEEARRLLALQAGAALREQDPAALAAAPHESVLALRPGLGDEIGDLVERQPEEVAQLLRGWLADRRSS